MARVLIVDDEASLAALLARRTRALGHEAFRAHCLADGLALCQREPIDVVLLDVRLPDGSGLDAVPRVKEAPSRPEVIIMTGAGDPDGAEAAVRSGAWDYIQKGASLEDLVLALENALAYRAEAARARGRRALDLGPIVGGSPALKACYDQLARAASSDTPVLVTGETGTGKELFARAVHDNSPRAGGPFVVVDCAALPETLVESTLFGHVRGAFTGATQEQPGLVAQADGGTLFLDEVGELPPSIQKSFLRVLQERRFRPVGGRSEAVSDFRLVAATNRDLDRLAEEGAFRADLLFRLRAVAIELPPLREREGDVRRLVSALLPARCERCGVETKGVSQAFLAALERYPWPGNVRELVQVLDAAVVAALGQETLYPVHLPAAVRVHSARERVERTAPALRVVTPAEAGPEAGDAVGAPAPTGPRPTFREVREAAGAAYLRQLMTEVGGDIAAACRLSGLSRSRLYDLLRQHDIQRADGDDEALAG